MEQMVITMKSQRGKVLLYSLSMCFIVSMKSTMGTSIIGGNLLRIKSDFIWVRLLSPKSDIILKLIGITGSDLFMKGSS